MKEAEKILEGLISTEYEVEPKYVQDRGSFDTVNLLRIAQSSKYMINNFSGLNEEEKKKLDSKIDDIMKERFKELNSSLSDITLKNMVESYERSEIYYPFDILVIDDAVFYKEGVINEDNRIYQIRIFRFEHLKPYFEITAPCFTYSDFCFNEEERPRLTTTEEEYVSKFISDNVNLISGENLVEINKNSVYGGVSSLNERINVYMNKDFYEIYEILKNKEECDIKMCVRKGEDMVLYYIHQYIKDNDPVWIVKKVNSYVWKMSEAIKRIKDKEENFVKHI